MYVCVGERGGYDAAKRKGERRWGWNKIKIKDDYKKKKRGKKVKWEDKVRCDASNECHFRRALGFCSEIDFI
jgi:hypothetical protein